MVNFILSTDSSVRVARRCYPEIWTFSVSIDTSHRRTLVPIVTPELVFGVALLLVFTQLYSGIRAGLPTQLIGHVTFTVSFVVIIIRSRLAAIGGQHEEAARDLGTNRFQALRLILLPLLGPAIFATLRCR